MADQDLDRNEAATPYKLEKAREKGQVGRSPEVVSALVFAVAVTSLYWKGWDGLAALFKYEEALLVKAARADATPPMLWDLIEQSLRECTFLIIPFLAAVVLAAVVGNLIQTGPVFSFEPLKPDFERLNPASGFKRLFSARTVFDAGRSLTKLVLMALLLYQALSGLVPQLLRLASMPTAATAWHLVQFSGAIGFRMAILLLLIAAVDLVFTRREFARKMRMSRRELREEHKHREGDPRIRARMRELRREALRRSMAVRKTATADVVVTNPTHYAVALRYEHGQMQSPQLVAKGAGVLAAGMRDIAARHRVPVVQNPPLARELYRSVEVDQFVPPALYAQVARILVWIFALREARSRRFEQAAA